MKKRNGPRNEPCGTPVFISNVLESILSNMTNCFIAIGNAVINEIRYPPH